MPVFIASAVCVSPSEDYALGAATGSRSGKQLCLRAGLLLGLLGCAPLAHAQFQSGPVLKALNQSAARALAPVSRPAAEVAAAADETPEEPNNFGTGVRVGATWANANTLEVGVFHQRALSRVFSVQAEAVYYRQRGATTYRGLHLPVLLVINPFHNLSVHAGPQLQWQPAARSRGAAPEANAVPTAAPAVSLGLALGAEARVSFLRFGLRFHLPARDLTDQAAATTHLATAWQTRQMQVYVGAGF